MVNKSRKDRTDAEIAKRRRLVASYYLMKMKQTDIATTLMQKGFEVTQSTVSRDLTAIKEEWRAEAREDIEAVIARELAGLDNMELDTYVMLQRAKKEKNTPEALRVVETLLKIGDSRRKLLGLDKQQIDVNANHTGQVVVNLMRASCKEPIPEDLVAKALAARKQD